MMSVSIALERRRNTQTLSMRGDERIQNCCATAAAVSCVTHTCFLLQDESARYICTFAKPTARAPRTRGGWGTVGYCRVELFSRPRVDVGYCTTKVLGGRPQVSECYDRYTSSTRVSIRRTSSNARSRNELRACDHPFVRSQPLSRREIHDVSSLPPLQPDRPACS